MPKIARADQLPSYTSEGISVYNFNDEDIILKYDQKKDTWTGEHIHWVPEDPDDDDGQGEWETERVLTQEEIKELLVRLQPITRKNIHEYQR